jgi:hypothetical protein
MSVLCSRGWLAEEDRSCPMQMRVGPAGDGGKEVERESVAMKVAYMEARVP